MQGQELPYFKFVSALIDAGIWARMSAAARTLYPVLLRFSDRNFKPVWPGTKLLLELTGFKQKASVRKARQELVQLGLIAMTPGTGGQRTFYHFRFDWGDTAIPRRGSREDPREGQQDGPGRGDGVRGGGVQREPPYNKIHISIINNVPGAQELAPLEKRFGSESVRDAVHLCTKEGLAVTPANVERILHRDRGGMDGSFSTLERELSKIVAPASLEEIRRAYAGASEGRPVFSDDLPDYLKALVQHISPDVTFVRTDGPPFVRVVEEA